MMSDCWSKMSALAMGKKDSFALGVCFMLDQFARSCDATVKSSLINEQYLYQNAYKLICKDNINNYNLS